MRPHKILCLGILLVVFVRQDLFAQFGQAIQKPAVSTVPGHSPTPKIAKHNSKHFVASAGVLACVSSPTRVMVSSLVMGCFVLDRVEPVYPAETQNVKDRLTLEVVVGKDGSILNARKISGPENLAPAALEAVRKWKYRPFLINGEPIEVNTIVDLPTLASNCGVSAIGVPPSWLFNARPITPVLASQGTPK